MSERDARRAKVKLLYDGVDISADISPYLLSFSYIDNAHGKADGIQVTLQDREGRWREPWYPRKGSVLKASIETFDWRAPGDNGSLYCGIFELDEIECSGPPTTVAIKGISVPVSTSLRREQKTRPWENVALSVVARDIAEENGVSLFWDAPVDPMYQRRDQAQTSDLAFLSELCREAGLSVKVTDEQIVIFDEEEYEQKSPVRTIRFGRKDITRYSFRSKTDATYASSKVSYHDALSDEEHDFEHEPEDAPDNGMVLRVNERVESLHEAERLAKKRLHEKNKGEFSGSISMLGDISLVGGVTVQIAGWGKFDGRYFLEKATHSVEGQGYSTTIELHGGKEVVAKRERAAPPQPETDFPVYKTN